MPAHLTSLPTELIFNILFFTEPACNPTARTYALYALAATNKHLHSIVEEYARLLLKRHVNIIPPKKARTFTCRKKWLNELCQLCLKNTKRKACFYPALTCCSDCDKNIYRKMTMTQASTTYHLSKLDLFTPSALHPHLLPLTTGIYPVTGGVATMISTPDVLARKEYIADLLNERLSHTRPARHERIIKHLNVAYMPEIGEWRSLEEPSEEAIKKGPKSMGSPRVRREYVEKALRREWEGMGMCEGRVVNGGNGESNGGEERESAVELE